MRILRATIKRMGLFSVSIEKERALLQRMEALGIREQEITEIFIKGGGSGGQKINKTSSCVYLRHEPTGIEVRCQRERSQSLNRFLARRELCDRIEERIHGVRAAEVDKIEKIRRQKRKRSRSGKKKMLASKARRADLKKSRGRPSESE